MVLSSEKPGTLALEGIATSVIRHLQRISEFLDERIVIIGGLCLEKLHATARKTYDLDFLLTADGAPQSVKSKLLALPDTPFREQAWVFSYVGLDGRITRVDFFSVQDFPFLPPAAVAIRDVSETQLPYLSATDLLVSKIFSCGLRADKWTNRRDAEDAVELMELVTTGGARLSLTVQHWIIVLMGYQDVVRYGQHSQAWWQRKLEIVEFLGLLNGRTLD